MNTGLEEYHLYHSLLHNGKRVRKLKRTELSNKKINSNSNKQIKGSNNRITSRSRQLKSLPKVQVSQRGLTKRNNQRQETYKNDQYYPEQRSKNYKIEIKQQSYVKNYNKTPKRSQLKFNNKTLKSESNLSMNKEHIVSKSFSSKNVSSYTNNPQSNPKEISKRKSFLGQDPQICNYDKLQKQKISHQYMANSRNSYQHKKAGSNVKQSIKKSKVSINYESSDIYFNEDLSQIKLKQQANKFQFSQQNSEVNLSIFKSSNYGDNKNKKYSNVKDSKIENSVSILKEGLKKSQDKPLIPVLNLNDNSEYSYDPTGKFKKRRNSFRNLPLSSREISLKSSRTSLNRPDPNTIQQIIERIQIHQYILALILDFSEQTRNLYHQEPNRTQILCFLLQKKYFYECSKFVKALKGGKSVFNLSSFQVPAQTLKQKLNHEEIKAILQKQEQKNITLFKQLQNQFRQLKLKYRNNPVLKLETPNDQFTQDIVNILQEQLYQLYDEIVESKLGENEQIEKQIRIIQIIEIVFLFSQLSGRKVKKIQFSEQIQNFQIYYDKNLPKICETIQYFQSIKPSN